MNNYTNDPDYMMAMMLQKQFEHEENINSSLNNLTYSPKKKHIDRTKSLTDSSWELIDPTPNIHNLFIHFNQYFFWNKLVTVAVSWSKRMTTCAGICSYQGRGGLCKITLSEPLLKLRPRKDLVETLLHEMIHAYLFITHNNRDRDGHGPEFHKHMYRINAEAGTNITVYHSFHDEVRLYQQHWWRCNGPCQNWKPYFGTVRRATNRAPGPNDFWWNDHERKCGGQFIKVKEPENFKSKKKKSELKKEKTINTSKDIRNFIPALKDKNMTNRGNVFGFKDLKNSSTKGAVKNSSSTIVINKTKTVDTNSNKTAKPSSSKSEQNTFGVFAGSGHCLTNNSLNSENNYDIVRKRWLDKYDNKTESAAVVVKKPKMEFSNDLVPCPICNERISNLQLNEHLDKCLLDQEKFANEQKCIVCNIDVPKSVIQQHVNECLEKIEKNSITENIEDHIAKYANNCVSCGEQVDGDMSEHLKQCLESAFNDEDSSDSSTKIPCLVCKKEIAFGKLSEHLEECNSFQSQDCIVIEDDSDDEEDDATNKYNCPFCLEKFSEDEMRAHLDNCLMK